MLGSYIDKAKDIFWYTDDYIGEINENSRDKKLKDLMLMNGKCFLSIIMPLNASCRNLRNSKF